MKKRLAAKGLGFASAIPARAASAALVFLAVAIVQIGPPTPPAAMAQSGVPDVNLNQSPSDGSSPFGYFRLVQCDGPDISGLSPDKQITVSIGGKQYSGTPSQLQVDGYTPCDFRGLTMEVQFLINVMTVLGVLAAIVGIVYAGGLYVTGSQKNIAKAKDIFPKLALGFILILTGWFIVFQILTWLTGNASALTGSGVR